MDIIPKSAPQIDSRNVDKSLEEFRNYIVDVLQLIDFTLSNQKNRINGAVSEENFIQLASAVQALKSEVSNLSGNVSSLSDRVGELENQISAIDGSIKSLDARVTALEQK